MRLTFGRLLMLYVVFVTVVVVLAMAVAALMGPQCVSWRWNGQRQELCQGDR